MRDESSQVHRLKHATNYLFTVRFQFRKWRRRGINVAATKEMSLPSSGSELSCLLLTQSCVDGQEYIFLESTPSFQIGFFSQYRQTRGPKRIVRFFCLMTGFLRSRIEVKRIGIRAISSVSHGSSCALEEFVVYSRLNRDAIIPQSISSSIQRL